MDDESLKKALFNSFEKECDMIENIDVPQYQTSEKFQFKMEEILNKTHKTRRITGKYAAALAMFFVLGILAGFSAYAASPTLRGFIISVVGGRSQISVNGIENSPEYIFVRYMPTLIPEGYKMIEISSGANKSVMAVYVKGDNQIFFGQYIKSNYQQVDMGTDKIEYYTDENGQEYVIGETDEGYVVIWENGSYVLHIFSTLSKEETIKICLSVKPAAE